MAFNDQLHNTSTYALTEDQFADKHGVAMAGCRAVLTGCRGLMCPSQSFCGLRLLMRSRFKAGMLAQTIWRWLTRAVDKPCMSSMHASAECR